MKEITRRGFTQASVVGAAAAVVGISSLPDRCQRRSSEYEQQPAVRPEDQRARARRRRRAHPRRQRTSEVALIAGEEEFVYHDAKLVSSVLSKFNKTKKE